MKTQLTQKEAEEIVRKWYAFAPHAENMTFEDYCAGVAFRFREVTGMDCDDDCLSLVTAINSFDAKTHDEN